MEIGGNFVQKMPEKQLKTKLWKSGDWSSTFEVSSVSASVSAQQNQKKSSHNKN